MSNNLNLLIATRFEIDSTLKKLKTTEHRFVQKKMNLGYAILDKIN